MRGSLGWEDIRAEVLRRIHARQWQPGALIPTEEQLAQEFGVARATVNRALRDLAGSGLIERRRKAGTRVTLTPVRRAVLEIAVIRLEVEARGEGYSYRLSEPTLAAAPDAIADRLGTAPDTPLWHLQTVHLAAQTPFAFEDRWLNPGVLPDAPQRVFAEVSVNEWLVRHIPYTRGDIAFSAANAQPHEAQMLNVPRGTALFITERTTWSVATAITFVRLAYAPGYRLQTEL